MRHFSFAAVALAISTLIVAGGTASAATIRVGYNLHEQSNDSRQFSDRLDAEISGSAIGLGATSNATASANASSGTLRMVARTELTEELSSDFTGRQSGGGATIGESFFISGTGMVQVRMLVSGSFQGSSGNFTADINSSAIGMSEVSSQFDNVFNAVLPQDGATSFSETIGVDYSKSGAGTAQLNVVWRIFGSATARNSNPSAFLDAGNTAYISIFGSDGITISPFTNGFLSSPATPPDNGIAAVPLPPAMPILAGGLLLLLGLGRQKRSG